MTCNYNSNYIDKRQKKVLIDISILNKIFNVNTYPSKKLVWDQLLPLELLMYLPIDSFRLLTSSCFSVYTIHFFIRWLKQYYYFNLFIRSEIKSIYTPLELIYKNKKQASVSIMLFFLCYFSFTSFTLQINTSNNIFWSISSVFRSFAWVERELSEFTDLTIFGAKDTRRLLTPYMSQEFNVFSGNYNYDTIMHCIY